MEIYRKLMYLIVVLDVMTIFVGLYCYFDEWAQELEEDRMRLQMEVQEASWACESFSQRICRIPWMGIIFNCDNYTPLYLPGRQVSPWWAPSSWPLLGIIFRLYQASKDVEELEILLKEMKESCQDNSSSQVMLVHLWVVVTVLGVLYYTWQFFRTRLLKSL
ncbi:hypothetical protein OTU49_012601, partial [Cherax quadricarinatus]